MFSNDVVNIIFSYNPYITEFYNYRLVCIDFYYAFETYYYNVILTNHSKNIFYIPNLTRLDKINTNFADKSLSLLTNLTSLNCKDNTNFTDKSLSLLTNLTNLN